MNTISISLFTAKMKDNLRIMLIKTGKKIDKKKIDDTLKQIEKKKVFDAKKHKDKVKWGEDGLEYQKRVRDEWD